MKINPITGKPFNERKDAKLKSADNASGLKGIDAWKKDAVNYIMRHPLLGRHSNIRISV